ncbi:glutaredoxin family protein [Cognatazoarcus halotolerans]|uniref:glutaredoxin family protein n=1 Tax=Cognatazoarcus halotolerans TaxID=2686016 RepID=UPI00135C6DF7|nr:glutaredoxin family protein [Cognatazoarcus halotolerans]MBX3679141.1 glutaredoxin family protein [Rhodocyclaceae bacterium]MCB1898065.1 glutaredoxin family protein [Rhodocyclaceae bacterium]MCP5309243.1 glutaredoxin family protein [Zoogloeaceae bacterium]
MAALKVFIHEWCHLCHDLLSDLAPVARELELSVEVVDLAGDPELDARWGEYVPVVMAGDKALCHYRLDADAVRAHFRNFR